MLNRPSNSNVINKFTERINAAIHKNMQDSSPFNYKD